MSQSLSQRIWPNHPAAEQIRQSRFLYSWAANSLAALIILACVISFWTREFRTVAKIELTSRGTSVDPTSVEKTIFAAIKEASSDDSLKETVRLSLGETGSPTDTPATVVDLDKLRQRLKFAVIPATTIDPPSVVIECRGSATATERALVENYTRHVREILDFGSQPLQQIEAESLDRIQTQKSLQNAMGSLDQLRTSINAMTTDLEAYQVELLNGSNADKLQKIELSWLHNQIANSFGNESQQMADFQTRFGTQYERIEAELETGKADSFQLSSTTLGGRPDRLKSIGDVRAAMLDLPIESLVKELGEVDRDLAVPLIDEATQTQSEVPLKVLAASKARHEAVGIVSDRSVLIGILLAALCVGWVVSAGINPAFFDAGFNNKNALEKTLNIPVVAEMKAQSNTNVKSIDSRQSILFCSELILMGTCLVFVGLFLSNAEMRDAILTNPLHALARIIWSIFH